MSNRAYVEVEHMGEMWWAKVYDDYGAGEIALPGKPPDSDVDLLRVIIQQTDEAQGTPFGKQVEGVLDQVQEMTKGITIRDTYYDWEEIAPAFEEAPQVG